MAGQTPVLMVISGSLQGSRFEVGPSGLRLGRSSSCEISIADPALSRNHCLFESRDGEIWVTDLASANGTRVNGTAIGPESVRLAAGDTVEAGDTQVRLLDGSEGGVPPSETVDLGLGSPAQQDAGDAENRPRPNIARLALWGAAGLAVAAAAFMIAGPQQPDGTPEQPETENGIAPQDAGRVVAVSFEKVRASAKGIYRFSVEYSADGTLAATIDDVPDANRHMEKSVRLSSEKQERLDSMLKDPALYELERFHRVPSASAKEYESCSLKIVREGSVFETLAENTSGPETLRDTREKLEAFVKNELGIWGIDKSAADLEKMSAQAEASGDEKWAEREVRHGNIALAIASYSEAAMLLETVDPKPVWYESLVGKLRNARMELDTRYREQCFKADRAINLKDWKTAIEELRTLCDLVPNDSDPRHAEANAKLLDVESRRKGDAK